MATIARMLVDIGGNNAALKSSLDKSTQYITGFNQNVDRLMRRSPLLGNTTRQGQQAAEQLLAGLQASFVSKSADLRERLFQGLIDVKTFNKKGADAAAEFNTGLTQGMEKLGNRGLLSGAVSAQLVSQYKDAGLRAGNAFNESLFSAGEKMTKAGKALTIGLTAPIVAADAAALHFAGDFQRNMNVIRAVLQPTIADFNAMEKAARDMGVRGNFSANEAAKGMLLLSRAGLNAQQIIGALPDTMNLAAASEVDLATAADVATSVLNEYGLAATKLGSAVDTMVKIQKEGKLTLNDINASMKFAAPIASQAGVSFNELSAALALLGKSGIRGALAGTTMRSAIVSLLKPTKQGAEILRKYGIDSLVSGGHIKSLSSVIDVLGRKGATTAEIMTLFTTRAGTGILKLVQKGGPALVEMTQKLEHAGGTAKRIADAQRSGLEGAMIRLKNAAIELAIAFANSGLIDAVTKVALKFRDLLLWVAALPKPVLYTVTVITTLLAVLGPLLIVLGSAAKAFITLRVAVALLSGTGGLASLGALLVPGGLILGGLVLLAYLFYRSGQAARDAKKEIDDFTVGLQPISNVNDLQNTLKTLESGVKRAEERKAALKKTLDAQMSTGGTGNAKTGIISGPAVETEKLIKAQDRLVEKYTNMAKAVRARIGDVTVETAKAKETTDALALAMSELSDLVNNVGGAGENGVEKLEKRFKLLIGFIETGMSQHTEVGDQLVSSYREMLSLLDKQGGKLDENTLKLKQMLEEFEKTTGFDTSRKAQLRDMVHPQTVSTFKTVLEPRPNTSGENLTGTNRAILALAGSSATAAIAMRRVADGASFAARVLGSTLGKAAMQFLDAINPLQALASVFSSILSSMNAVLAPLQPIFDKLGRIVAAVLAPLFKALEPVLNALLPVIQAILQVLVPIIIALVPVLKVFVIILRAIFPIIKLVIIAFTYLAQIVLLVAGFFAKAVGSIISGFGHIVLAIAKAIDKLPGISAKGAIKAAKATIAFGDSMVQVGGELVKASKEMGKARKEISGIQIGDTIQGLDELGDTARATSEALRNVPEGFKLELERFLAQLPANVAPPGPINVPTTPWNPPTPPGGTGGGGTPPPGEVFINLSPGAIVVQGATDPAKTAAAVVNELKNKAKAMFGDSTKWSQVT